MPIRSFLTGALSVLALFAGSARAESVSLGFKLFFDKRLSVNGQVACETCHLPAKLFADGKKTAEGIGHGSRHAPQIADMASRVWFMWDGRAPSLEQQALLPIEDPVEHGFSRGGVAWIIANYYDTEWTTAHGPLPKELKAWLKEKSLDEAQALPAHDPKHAPDPMVREAISTIQDTPFLRLVFAESQKRGGMMQSALMAMYDAGPKPPSIWTDRWAKLDPKVARGIEQVFNAFSESVAAFVRTIQTGKTKVESGQKLTDSEARGMALFNGKASCVTCHQGRDFTDNQFHNIGLVATAPYSLESMPDLGRAFGVGVYRNNTSSSKAICATLKNQACAEAKYLNVFAIEPTGAFKTPSLRNVARTAPYMHDGSLATLDDVLTFYNRLPLRASVGQRTGILRSLGFSAGELADLKAFLGALSAPVTYSDGVKQYVVE